MTVESIFVILAVVFYGATCVLAVVSFLRSGPDHRLGLRTTVIAALCLGLALVCHAIEFKRLPVFGWFESLAFYGLLVTLVYLYMAARHDTRGLSLILMPYVTILVILGASRSTAAPAEHPPAAGVLMDLHILTAFIGYALFTLSAVLALAYLLQDRNLKRKHHGAIFEKLPALETLDHLMSSQIAVAFGTFTISLLLGILLTHLSRWGVKWLTDPKILATVVTWAVYAILFYLRTSGGYHGRKAAIVIIGAPDRREHARLHAPGRPRRRRMNLLVIGINFRTAPLELRETLSFREEDIPGVLQRIKWDVPETELVLLSTCNRTELYAAGPTVRDHQEILTGLLVNGRKAPVSEELRNHFYTKEDLEVVSHLLAVTASLDSMVVGETEIVGQVKRAYALADKAGTRGKTLNKLFQKAFKAAKRIHTETEICRGRVSVSSIAVEFAEKIFDDLSTKTVMIVGAGETSELTLLNLVKKGVKQVLVLNRSLERGKALAEKHGGKAIPIDLIDDYLPSADIVISSTNAPHCVIKAESVKKAVGARHSRPVLLIDIAVPRDIDPEAADLDNAYLYNIDDLQALASENLARRQEALDKAFSIVREETEKLTALFRIQDLGSLIRRLEETTAAVKEAELNRALAKKNLASIPEAGKEEIRILLHRTVNRILSAPKNALKEAAKNGRGEEYMNVVREVFGIGEEDDSERE